MSAPGKLFLSGEYGVLAGGEALVMAVERRVAVGGPRGHVPGDGATADPLVSAVLGLARKITVCPPYPPLIDDRDLFGVRGDKLGLGSSAAKAAALAASALLAGGACPGDPGFEEAVLDLAWRAHREAGGGSGADVAAAVLGGVVRYRLLRATIGSTRHDRAAFTRPNGEHRGLGPPNGETLADEADRAAFEAERVDPPARHLPLVVRGQSPVSTRNALRALESALLEESAPHRASLEDATGSGERLTAALLDGGTLERQLVEAVTDSSRALTRLGELLKLGEGSAIELVRSASKVARRFGGAVKPSGAGGGDIVLVFVPGVEPEDRAQVARALDNAGHEVLDVKLAKRGVRSH